MAGISLTTALVVGASAAAWAVATPSTVLQSSRAAVDSESGVHVAFIAHSDTTSITERIVADVSSSGGSEKVSEGSSFVDIKVTPSFAYVSGNSLGLQRLFGMSAAGAKKIGKEWVSLEASSSQYRALKSDVTMSSVTALFPKVKGTTMTTAKYRGASVYILKWTVPASGSVPKLSDALTISASGPPLPLLAKSTASGGTTISTTLTEWGEKVVVQPPPPASVVPSSKIAN